MSSDISLTENLQRFAIRRGVTRPTSVGSLAKTLGMARPTSLRKLIGRMNEPVSGFSATGTIHS